MARKSHWLGAAAFYAVLFIAAALDHAMVQASIIPETIAPFSEICPICDVCEDCNAPPAPVPCQ